MQLLNQQGFPLVHSEKERPERIIQFGEGNFLRGFVDWMVHRLNQQGLFNGRVVAVQPTPYGKVVPKLNAQDGLYTLVLRGITNGEVTDQTEVVSSISRGINPYEDWQEVLKLAESDTIKFVFSNTTEAGIVYQKESFQSDQSPMSFPGKLTAFLFHRYNFFGGSANSGLKIIPCELVEGNGTLLKNIVLKICRDWMFPETFYDWVGQHNCFCNTLVDRIVTGYPKDDIEKFEERLGYEDALLTVGEPYHLFAIETDKETKNLLPFHKAGLNVHWDDVQSFRELKVRILNGAHTMMFAAAYLSGKDTVLEAMEDDIIRRLIDKSIYKEILPVLDVELEKKKIFADSVIERFLNPFNKHLLTDLGMGAVFKYKTRVLPSLFNWVERERDLPEIAPFSLAALIAYYKSERVEKGYMIGVRGNDRYVIRDKQDVMTFFKQIWNQNNGDDESLKQLVRTVLGNEQLWDQDLNDVTGFTDVVHRHLLSILNLGMEANVLRLSEDIKLEG